jgi:hypothetical protein
LNGLLIALAVLGLLCLASALILLLLTIWVSITAMWEEYQYWRKDR